MTHEEYNALVSRYEDFLCEVEKMQLELGQQKLNSAIAKLIIWIGCRTSTAN